MLHTFMEIVGQRPPKDRMAECVLFKIVDLNEKTGKYTLQCLETSGVIITDLYGIILDIRILHGLHPIQACYIGIEYVTRLDSQQATQQPSKIKHKKHRPVCAFPASRYGQYELLATNRKNNILFTKRNDSAVSTMDPRDIALSDKLISQFDAAQAYYIGLLAGEKMQQANRKSAQSSRNKRMHLRIIK